MQQSTLSRERTTTTMVLWIALVFDAPAAIMLLIGAFKEKSLWALFFLILSCVLLGLLSKAVNDVENITTSEKMNRFNDKVLYFVFGAFLFCLYGLSFFIHL